MAKPIIETENLSHLYPGRSGASRNVALKEVNVKICPGEMVAIVGRNGCGKTTLVKHFNGLLLPTEGRVLVKGMDTRVTERSTLAYTVGMVFQHPGHQLFERTCWKEVSFGPKNMKRPQAEIARIVQKSLTLVGLWEFRELHPHTLTMGSKQKLALASILANDPDVIVMDEPMTGLSQVESSDLMKILRKLNTEKKITVIFVTHNMNLVSDFAERTIVMGAGSILMDASTQEVFSKPEILEKTSLKPPEIPSLANRLSEMYKFIPSGVLSVEEMSKILTAKLQKPTRT